MGTTIRRPGYPRGLRPGTFCTARASGPVPWIPGSAITGMTDLLL